MAFRQIYYIGNDIEILAQLRKFYCSPELASDDSAFFIQQLKIDCTKPPEESDDSKVVSNKEDSRIVEDRDAEGWDEALFSNFMSYLPELVYVDFSGLLDFEENLELLTESIMIFKTHPILVKVPFVALFGDKGELNSLRYLFSNGITGGYIKGFDNDKMMRDSCYIAFGNSLKSANQKNTGLQFKHSIKAIGNVAGIYSDCIIFETNVDLGDEGEQKLIEVDLGISSVFLGKKFLCAGKVANSFRYNFSHSYKLSVPPEESVTDMDKELVVDKKMIRKWVEVNRDIFKKRMGSVLVVGNDLDDLYEALNYRKASNYYLTFAGQFDKKFRMVEELRPSIIAVQVIEEEDDDTGEDENPNAEKSLGDYIPNNLNTIFSLVQKVKKLEDYNPMIMTFNNQSTTEAFQKTFRYENLYSIPYCINFSFLNNLIGVYRKSYQDKFKGTRLDLPTIDSRRFSLMKQSIEITCINEDEITFQSKFKYPYYSLIKVEVPTQIYLIIVPPTRTLEQVEGSNHHMAFYCGTRPADLKTFWGYFNKKNPGKMKELEFESEKVSTDDTAISGQDKPQEQIT